MLSFLVLCVSCSQFLCLAETLSLLLFKQNNILVGHCHIMNYVSPGGGNRSTSIFIGGLRMLFFYRLMKIKVFLPTTVAERLLLLLAGKFPKKDTCK